MGKTPFPYTPPDTDSAIISFFKQTITRTPLLSLRRNIMTTTKSAVELGLQKEKMFEPKKMLFRNLGPSGLRVPVFSLGGWLTLGGNQKGDVVKEIMSLAYDNGINMFDTAEGYAEGNSEVEMGRVIKEMGWQRSDLVIT